MDGIPEVNRNQSIASDSTAGAPPPPTEVKIRTMRSDLEGLAASGGGLPKFESVKVSGLSIDSKLSIAAIKKNGALMTIVITVVAVIVLGILGYVAYRILG